MPLASALPALDSGIYSGAVAAFARYRHLFVHWRLGLHGCRSWSPGARSKCAGRSPARRHSSRLVCDLGRLTLDGGRNQTGKNDWKSPAATACSTKSGLSGVGGRGRSRRPRLLGRRPRRSCGSIQDHAEAARIVCEAIPLERSNEDWVGFALSPDAEHGVLRRLGELRRWFQVWNSGKFRERSRNRQWMFTFSTSNREEIIAGEERYNHNGAWALMGRITPPPEFR